MVTKTKAEKATESEATSTDETPIDLSAFQKAVSDALSTADESTGTVPEAGLAQTLAAYRELPDVKAKNAARAWLDVETREGVMGGNILKARATVEVKENLSSGSSGSKAAPKDPTEGFIARVAQLSAAYSLVVSNVPEGVAEDWQDKANAKAAELVEGVNAFNALDDDADDSEVAADVKKVAKLAAGRGGAGGTFTGIRRNVSKHLEQVFADLPKGSFLTVTEISKADSAEYGDEHPTTGAVSARLFPKSGNPSLPEGIEAIVPDDGSARGARKN